MHTGGAAGLRCRPALPVALDSVFGNPAGVVSSSEALTCQVTDQVPSCTCHALVHRPCAALAEPVVGEEKQSSGD